MVTDNQSTQDLEETILLLSHFKADCLKMEAGRKGHNIPLVAAAHGGPALEQDGSALIQFYVSLFIFHKH